MNLSRREFFELGAAATVIGVAALVFEKALNEPRREAAEEARGEPVEPPP